MRIRYVEPDLALQYAQEAIEGGVITSTDENALLQTYRQITVTNPLEMIWNSYNDARMGASMDSYLNGYEDPRRERKYEVPPHGSSAPREDVPTCDHYRRRFSWCG